ncbi:hypothetical protein D3C75_1130160 [compost metagenome]
MNPFMEIKYLLPLRGQPEITFLFVIIQLHSLHKSIRQQFAADLGDAGFGQFHLPGNRCAVDGLMTPDTIDHMHRSNIVRKVLDPLPFGNAEKMINFCIRKRFIDVQKSNELFIHMLFDGARRFHRFNAPFHK